MLTVWRVVKSRYAASAFDGEGARLFGGRWSSPGLSVVYAADTAALAVLEVLVHLQNTAILESYSLVSADVPPEIVEDLSLRALPSNWMRSPAPPEAQAVGDTWIRRARSAALSVPSAVLPYSHIYLLNPAHPDFARIRIGEPQAFRFDPRLIR